MAGGQQIEREISSSACWQDCVFDLDLQGQQELRITYLGNQTVDILELEFMEA